MTLFLDHHRDGVRTHIEETVEGWQFTEISKKLEREVGRDLQFVRLNGTIVGGIVGVLIHSVGRLF